MGIESENEMFFPDVIIQKQENGELKIRVDRKPNHVCTTIPTPTQRRRQTPL